MLIESIGEGINKIDKLSEGNLLNQRPDIPWRDIIGIRNHIAHGYFDIDGDAVYAAVKNDLESLLEALDYLSAINSRTK